MKTIRRRAASPALAWASAGPRQEYRVIVRNLNSGERRLVYQGFRTECRLPPDMRLTPDQLAFRVMTRPTDDPEGRFIRAQEHHPIPRLGDDYETPADDLLVAKATKGADAYRLWVRNEETGRVVVDMARPEPRFLLPPGLLRDGTFRYEFLTKIGAKWRKGENGPITKAMLVAADARSERMVPPPPLEIPEILGAAADHAPGLPDRLGPPAPPVGPWLLVTVNVTAEPALSPIADPRDVTARQWWSGDRSGAVESVALGLEAHGLSGLFMLDVLAGTALGDEATAMLAAELSSRGHGLGLMVNPAPWRGLSSTAAALTSETALQVAMETYERVVGGPPLAVSFSEGGLAPSVLRFAREAGVQVIVADRAAQLEAPAWMRWRTKPFAAFDDMIVIPDSMVLSTPAHERDRAVRHPLSSTDPMTADDAEAVAAAIAKCGDQTLISARIDPLALLLKTQVRSPEQADAWNQALSDHLPHWADAGWERSPHGYPVLSDRDEIKLEMMTALISSLGRAGVTCADMKMVFAPEMLRNWAGDTEAFDPLVEQRRGPRRLRRSAVRRYDASYRQALSMESA